MEFRTPCTGFVNPYSYSRNWLERPSSYHCNYHNWGYSRYYQFIAEAVNWFFPFFSLYLFWSFVDLFWLILFVISWSRYLVISTLRHLDEVICFLPWDFETLRLLRLIYSFSSPYIRITDVSVGYLFFFLPCQFCQFLNFFGPFSVFWD